MCGQLASSASKYVILTPDHDLYIEDTREIEAVRGVSGGAVPLLRANRFTALLSGPLPSTCGWCPKRFGSWRIRKTEHSVLWAEEELPLLPQQPPGATRHRRPSPNSPDLGGSEWARGPVVFRRPISDGTPGSPRELASDAARPPRAKATWLARVGPRTPGGG